MPEFAPNANASRPVHIVAEAELQDWLAMLPAVARGWAEATGFKAALGEVLLLPDTAGQVVAAVVGYGS